ncbi:hypothetical protein DPMN_110937 [Dreissena polymorpha]|uniref:Uncharacterized protein n=1 Tax=Dreissena polymorpha TaxID=45954 RepID=A0A9D4KDQ0_DREPO|nr:hypothetical protein DPMN_110937 [Dreissena polymorpha]
MQRQTPKLTASQGKFAMQRRNNCSYIQKQKAYLGAKGFDMKNIYSLNRHNSLTQKQNNKKSIVNENRHFLPAINKHIASKLESDFTTGQKQPYRHKSNVYKNSEKVWRQKESWGITADKPHDEHSGGHRSSMYVEVSKYNDRRLGRSFAAEHLRKFMHDFEKT